jgi:hypothetical protein
MLISSMVLVSASAFAHNLPLNSVWQSSYISGQGRFQVNVISQDNVSIIEDLNICYFNIYGQNTGCTTNMGYYYNTGKLLKDTIVLDRISTVWSLEGSPYGIGYNLGYSASGYINLLKFNYNGQVTESIWLQKVQ